jgi:hypothetical protein
MARPAYAVYRVNSFAGSAFSERDVPDRLRLIEVCQAVNSDHARDLVMGADRSPVLVVRVNTIEQGALKLP